MCLGRRAVRPTSADLANRFANNDLGRPRMQLDQATVCKPQEQAGLTTTD
jgi:hypothetical protein